MSKLDAGKNSDASRRYSVSATLVLVVSIAVTIFAYYFTLRLVHERAKDKFDFQVRQIQEDVRERLLVYEQVLWATAGLVNAYPGKVTRQAWQTYVATLGLNKHWPGIQGIGYSIPITQEDLALHEKTIRDEGFPEYRIWPQGLRDEYSAIIYLEPFNWRNQRAFGFDMWAEPNRREAMRRAKEEGVAATSGMITLVQETDEDVQKGFLTYVPVYSGGTIPATKDERVKSFQAWVYVPFRAGDLMTAILERANPQMRISLYDDDEARPENLMYENHSNQIISDLSKGEMFEKLISLNLQGRAWTLKFQISQQALMGNQRKIPGLVAVLGFAVDLLLFYVVLSLQFINRKAMKIAKESTLQLQRRSSELEKNTQDLEEKVRLRTAELERAKEDLEGQVVDRTKEMKRQMEYLEQMNTVMIGRELKMIELKKEVDSLKNQLGESQ